MFWPSDRRKKSRKILQTDHTHVLRGSYQEPSTGFLLWINGNGKKQPIQAYVGSIKSPPWSPSPHPNWQIKINFLQHFYFITLIMTFRLHVEPNIFKSIFGELSELTCCYVRATAVAPQAAVWRHTDSTTQRRRSAAQNKFSSSIKAKISTLAVFIWCLCPRELAIM